MNVAVNAYCNRVIRDMYTPYTLAIPNYFASPRAIYFHLFISKRVYLPTLHLRGPAAVNAANVRTRWFLIDIYFHARKKTKKKIRDKRQRAICIIRAALSRRSRYCIPMCRPGIFACETRLHYAMLADANCWCGLWYFRRFVAIYRAVKFAACHFKSKRFISL